jgi:hypothetical protein
VTKRPISRIPREILRIEFNQNRKLTKRRKPVVYIVQTSKSKFARFVRLVTVSQYTREARTCTSYTCIAFYHLTDEVGNPKEDMDENGVKVSVISKDPTTGTAVVRIV